MPGSTAAARDRRCLFQLCRARGGKSKGILWCPKGVGAALCGGIVDPSLDIHGHRSRRMWAGICRARDKAEPCPDGRQARDSDGHPRSSPTPQHLPQHLPCSGTATPQSSDGLCHPRAGVKAKHLELEQLLTGVNAKQKPGLLLATAASSCGNVSPFRSLPPGLDTRQVCRTQKPPLIQTPSL